MDITQADLTNLTEKLQALDLTDGERALLGRIIDAASDDEVTGFGSTDPFGNLLGVGGRFVGPGTSSPLGFAESGKKADAQFAESGKKADSL